MRKQISISSLLIAGWLVWPGQAAAFEERPATPMPAPSAPSAAPAKDDTVDLKIAPGKPGLEEPKDKPGWAIPGLGSINLFPKLDFGLELMYGDSPAHTVEDPVAPDDVTIRGTVKRRF